MTNEVKNIIDQAIEKMVQDVIDAVTLGLHEDMSPNDVAFDDEMERLLDEASEYLVDKVKVVEV